MSRDIAVGDTVVGRFLLRERVGRGGMGQVFRAEDLSDGRVVALKAILGHDSSGGARFMREAQTLATLRHPAIVGYVAHGLTDGGHPFLAMDWLDGEDLGQVLRRGPLSLTDTVALLRRLASGLAVAHAQGVVHRDLKPANVVLIGGLASEATLVDFGIARPALAHTLTRTGAIVGTAGYMAPEQIEGQRDLDGRADLFSLGCVAYECLTGRTPFGSESLFALLARVLLDDAPRVRESLAGVPAALDDLIASLLERDRTQRLPSAVALVDALAGLELGDAVEAGSAATIAVSTRPTLDTERTPSAVVLAWPLMLPASAYETMVDQTVAVDSRSASHSLTESIVQRWGGSAIPVAGGLVMLSFAQGGSLQELVRRAAHAALELHAALPSWTVSLGLSMVEATDTGNNGTSTPGSAEISSRPRSSEVVAGVVVEPSVAALLPDELLLETSAGSLILSAQKSQRDEPRKVLGRSAPCLGRDKELRLLEATLDECIDEQAARAVLFVGPPGIGKSRIRREFMARIGERGEVVAWTARSEVVAQSAALGLIRAWIREAFEVVGASASARWESLRAAALPVLAHDVGPERATTLVEFFGELADVPPPAPGPALIDARSSPLEMRQQLQAALVAWLRGFSHATPVALVLEDLHWADPSSTTLLASAWAQLGEAPVLLLVTSRPEGEQAHSLLFGLKAAQVVKLEPLGKRASERLVRQLLGDAVATPTAQRIVELAGGNVFLLEEIVRHVGEGRSLDSLPATAIAVVQARLATLPAEARKLLRIASVLGERFELDTLAALLHGDGETAELSATLELLRREELVLSPADEREAGTAWSFRHSLVRQAAYEMLTGSDRTRAHRAAAEWIAAGPAVEPALVAEHFERAGCIAEAGPWLLRAIEVCEELGDIEAARDLAIRADRPEVAPDTRAEAAYFHLYLQVQLGAHFVIEEMIARVDRHEFPPGTHGWSSFSTGVLALKVHLGHGVDVRAEFRALIEGGLVFRPVVSSVRNLSLLTVSFVHLGLLDEAQQVAKMLTDLTSSPDTPAGWIATRDAYVPWVLAVQDDPRMLEQHRNAVDVARSCSVLVQSQILPAYILFAVEYGCEAEALEVMESLGADRTSGLPFNDFEVLGKAAIALFGAEPQDCRALLAEQRTPEWKHVDLWLRGYCIASAALARPDDRATVEHALAGLEAVLADCGPMQTHRCSIASLIAECALLLGDAERAMAAIEIVREAGDILMPLSRTHALLVRIQTLRALGREQEARAATVAAQARLHRFVDGLAPADRETFLSTRGARSTLAL